MINDKFKTKVLDEDCHKYFVKWNYVYIYNLLSGRRKLMPRINAEMINYI